MPLRAIPFSRIRLLIGYFLMSNCLFSCNLQDHRNQTDAMKFEPGYEWVKDWPSLPEGFKLGNPTGLAIDSSGNLLVFHRASREWPDVGPLPDSPITEKTILVIDPGTGRLLDSWGDHLFIMPHGLQVDKDNNIWLTDCGLHQVMKFSHNGQLLMKLGEAGKPGHDSAHFNMPTDVAIAQDGSFYVSDGYGNSRIVKFSSTGKFLFEWGRKGTKQSEFDIPHALTLDHEGHVYVADRENRRVQIFDADGHFLQEWKDDSYGRISSIAKIPNSSNLIAVDDKVTGLELIHLGSDLIEFDHGGKVLHRLGRTGSYDGPKCWYHDLTVDKYGNIYIGDILGNTIQKFRKKE